MRCPECDSPVEDSHKFCEKCGAGTLKDAPKKTVHSSEQTPLIDISSDPKVKELRGQLRKAEKEAESRISKVHEAQNAKRYVEELTAKIEVLHKELDVAKKNLEKLQSGLREDHTEANTADLLNIFGVEIKSQYEIEVCAVIEPSIAWRADIQEGDVITSIGGWPTPNLNSASEAVLTTNNLIKKGQLNFWDITYRRGLQPISKKIKAR